MRKLIVLLLLTSCMSTGTTKLKSVDSVDINKYTGTWYEILRLPNRFERGLKCITANYSLRADGRINVVNRGRMISDPHKTDEANGKAWIPDPSKPAQLKVSFFWPFSGKYWILYLDPDYKYVLVGEPSLKYLWILSRTPQLEESAIEDLLNKARDMGYDTKPVIRVEHDCP